MSRAFTLVLSLAACGAPAPDGSPRSLPFLHVDQPSIDTDEADRADGDTAEDDDHEDTGDTGPPEDTGDTDAPDPRTPWGLDRIVVVGDIWGQEIVPTVQVLLWREGFDDVEIVHEQTTGRDLSAAQLAHDHEGRLTGLAAALDGGETGADLLIVAIGARDYLGALQRGLPADTPFDDAIVPTLDTFERDLAATLRAAREGRPELEIVLIGYDYLHFDVLTRIAGLDLDAPDRLAFNRGLAELERRRRDLAALDPRVHYVHNLGLLTHAVGNPRHPELGVPTADVPPGYFDAPAGPPSYEPFPGGARRDDLDPTDLAPESLPMPAHATPDGLTLNNVGWMPLVDNCWNTVLEPLFWRDPT